MAKSNSEPSKKVAKNNCLKGPISSSLDENADIELKRRGIYYITGPIDDGDLIEIHQDILLKHLDKTWKDDIQIIINSIGGSCAEGWALIDLLDFVKMDVKTVAMGDCCSLGAMLVSCGTKGKRISSKNSSLMVHGTQWSGLDGDRGALVSQMNYVKQEHKRTVNFWIKNSKYKTTTAVEKIFLNGIDQYMTPKDALKHGIIDYIQT